jgi:hypothetical protein
MAAQLKGPFSAAVSIATYFGNLSFRETCFRHGYAEAFSSPYLAFLGAYYTLRVK